MKKIVFSTLAFVGLFFTACDSKTPITSSAVSKTKVNEEVEKFESQTYSLITTDEKIIGFTSTEEGLDFDEFKDKKAVIIDIFATWCPPCIESLPMLKETKEKNKDDLEIVSVLFQDPKTLEEIKDFIKEHQINYPITMGSDNQRLADELNVKKVPEMFLFSKSGKFVHRFVGKVPQEELEKYLKIAIEN
ncbi:TlpA family protein disulfide reductase [Arcobacter vandammei]|uniref:TlpA family protein disulfide reductase n=1 Tax=Arcobacter vandammei TaxID=2782243 RepID=UPI0018E048DD|nr:TlpA disulfide reductase family protein [Arcobacter vandammei]